MGHLCWGTMKLNNKNQNRDKAKCLSFNKHRKDNYKC